MASKEGLAHCATTTTNENLKMDQAQVEKEIKVLKLEHKIQLLEMTNENQSLKHELEMLKLKMEKEKLEVPDNKKEKHLQLDQLETKLAEIGDKVDTIVLKLEKTNESIKPEVTQFDRLVRGYEKFILHSRNKFTLYGSYEIWYESISAMIVNQAPDYDENYLFVRKQFNTKHKEMYFVSMKDGKDTTGYCTYSIICYVYSKGWTKDLVKSVSILHPQVPGKCLIFTKTTHPGGEEGQWFFKEISQDYYYGETDSLILRYLFKKPLAPRWTSYGKSIDPYQNQHRSFLDGDKGLKSLLKYF